MATSKTRVSSSSNSNSFPHSGAGHLALNRSLPPLRSDGSLTTTHVPHFGQLTHEQAIRSAMSDYMVHNHLFCSSMHAIMRFAALSLQMVLGAGTMALEHDGEKVAPQDLCRRNRQQPHPRDRLGPECGGLRGFARAGGEEWDRLAHRGMHSLRMHSHLPLSGLHAVPRHSRSPPQADSENRRPLGDLPSDRGNLHAIPPGQSARRMGMVRSESSGDARLPGSFSSCGLSTTSTCSRPCFISPWAGLLSWPSSLS